MNRRNLIACITFWVLCLPLFPSPDARAVSSVDTNVTTVDAVDYSSQRKTFYANGLWWVFYSNGTGIVYKTSPDESTWSSATTVKASCNVGYRFALHFDGTYVHYVFSTQTDNTPLLYRRGTPNGDGTITWSAAEQTAVPISTYLRYVRPAISVDSSGYPWIGYRYRDDSGTVKLYPYVTKSSTNGGTWTTAGGFPYQLNTTSNTNWHAIPVPLTAAKVYVVYGYNSATAKGRLYNSGWGSEEAASTSNINSEYYTSAVGINDDVHFAFLKDTTYDIVHRIRTYGSGWGGETTVQSGTTSSSGPTLTLNSSASNDLYCFWAGSPTAGHVYVKRYTSGAWSASPYDWFSDTLPDNNLSAFYKDDGNNRMGVAINTGSGSPYTLKYESMNPTVITLASFSATIEGGSVEVEWVTKTEIDNLGFNLYRSINNGPLVQLNRQLIPGLISSIAGRSYTYTDTGTPTGTPVCYTLEDLDLSGTKTSHGPACVYGPAASPTTQEGTGAAINPAQSPTDVQQGGTGAATDTGTPQGGTGAGTTAGGGTGTGTSPSGPVQFGSVTSVKLKSLTAHSDGEGVLIAWTTGQEMNNLGFNVYRQDHGQRVKLTTGPLAGSALRTGSAPLAAGHAYRFYDPQPGSGYWVEDIGNFPRFRAY